ncbi:MAG: tRNA pseudouridine(38-40) synthase TruA [Acidobacteriota bacterium]
MADRSDSRRSGVRPASSKRRPARPSSVSIEGKSGRTRRTTVPREQSTTYKLLIEYEGTRYSGWQAQSNTPKTVQGRLVAAASQTFGAVEIGGSGRTDAGVHAAGQVAHLRMNKKAAPDEIRRALNDELPADIHVIRVEPVSDRFHARHDALGRVYLYQISTRRTAFAKPFVWWIKDRLDVDRMAEAAQLIAGRRDFTRFTDKRATNESMSVEVELADVAPVDDLILVRIAASHFLWKMVRKLVSALVEVGRGTLPQAEFDRLLNDPAAAPFQPTASPSGLFLEAVIYPGEQFDRPLLPIVPVSTILGASVHRKRNA